LSMNDPRGTEEEPLETITLSDDPKFKYDNHVIHFNIHRDFIIGAEFRELSPDAKQTLIGHTDLHKFGMKAQIEEAMQQQIAMQEAAGGQKPAK